MKSRAKSILTFCCLLLSFMVQLDAYQAHDHSINGTWDFISLKQKGSHDIDHKIKTIWFLQRGHWVRKTNTSWCDFDEPWFLINSTTHMKIWTLLKTFTDNKLRLLLIIKSFLSLGSTLLFKQFTNIHWSSENWTWAFKSPIFVSLRKIQL